VWGFYALTRIIRSIEINAPPSTLWMMMVKHLKYPRIEDRHGPEWSKLVIKDTFGEALSEKRAGVGVKTRWFYKFHRFSFNWDDEVSDWVEGRKIEWKAISTWRMVDSFTIEPQGEGCRLVYEMDYTPPYWIFGRIFYYLFVNKHLERHLEYVLRQMKRSAEGLKTLKK
jgi:uncharacterized membrane protein